ncbi:hypothetical protein L596_007906 [Steinernema carpocapsae]|uniref:Uncharacterized protein n=1 Tax=Steinernema carpocapsae TaxID=34508 RepID=A0A4U5PB48_STECR|nr:hypothetical protein L596_007906 [Steinernema carpocapsae]
MSSSRIWKKLFFACLAANFVLCFLLGAVLGFSLASEEKPSLSLLTCFAAFLVLYFALLGAFFVFAQWETRPALVLSIIFAIAQCACLLMTEIILLTSEVVDYEEEAAFAVTPITWIKQQPNLLLLFGALFLSTFICEMALFHRLTCGVQERVPVLDDGDHRRKSTPYHAEKIHISKLG